MVRIGAAGHEPTHSNVHNYAILGLPSCSLPPNQLLWFAALVGGHVCTSSQSAWQRHRTCRWVSSADSIAARDIRPICASQRSASSRSTGAGRCKRCVNTWQRALLCVVLSRCRPHCVNGDANALSVNSAMCMVDRVHSCWYLLLFGLASSVAESCACVGVHPCS